MFTLHTFRYIIQDIKINTNKKSKIILVWFRLSQILSKYKASKVLFFPLLLLYRVIVEWFLGIELNWNLRVGRLKLYHGQGLLINPATIIGKDCTLRGNTAIGNKELFDGTKSSCPVIGDNVNIGPNSCIIGDIKIGNNVIIGAGSVVVKDVPDNVVVAGNPAKIIRRIEVNKMDINEKNKILLYGPPVGKSIKFGYGGGTGGYTRNMAAHLNFTFDDYEFCPLFHTVRGEINLGKFSFVLRFLIDYKRILLGLLIEKPSAIHILAQYRTATIREFILAPTAFLFGIPYLYEIKAGSFISFYENTNAVNRFFLKYIIKHAKIVFCEGEVYIPFLKKEFNKESYYLPNFVLSSEIPDKSNVLFKDEVLRIVFVGYCMRAKGVFELVDGVYELITQSSIKVELTLIGSEDKEFSNYMDSLAKNNDLIINRMGRLNHKDVLNELSKNDIYCYPTSHKGEGHNNSINEAMMFGQIIITTKQGFLDGVLSNDSAYFLDKVSSDEISNTLEQIFHDKDTAREKAKMAREKLISSYSDKVIYGDLLKYYHELID